MLTETMIRVAAAVPLANAPDPEPNAPGGIQTAVETILGLILYLVIAGCVAGVLFVAGKLALAQRRGEPAENLGGLLAVAGACVLAATAAALVNFLMI